MLKNLITKSLILVLFSSPLLLIAGEAERRAVNELLEASRFEKIMDDTINASIEMVKQMDPNMGHYEDELRAFYKKYMSAESLREEMIDLYAEIFTEKELNEMTAFYRTATGQKALENLPKIMNRSMQIVQARVTQNMDELLKMLPLEQDND